VPVAGVAYAAPAAQNRIRNDTRMPGRIYQPASLTSVQLVLMPVLFFLGAKLSLVFAIQPESLVILWMPNGLLLATLLHFGLRRYGWFTVAILIAEVAADYPTYQLTESLLYGLINLGEATLAWAILRRWRFNPSFSAPRDLGCFLVAGPLLSALVAACAAAAVYWHYEENAVGYLEFLRIWWFSDGVGVLLITPLVLSVWPVRSSTRVGTTVKLRWYDLFVAMAVVVLLAMFLMARDGQYAGWPVRPVLLLPFVLYASVRLTPRATTIVLTLVAIAALFVTASGRRPFGPIDLQQTILQVQQFIIIIAVGGLGISSLLAQLRANVAQLELRVLERTSELREANERLRQLAVTDALTGLANRRALFEAMNREIERSRRHAHPLTIIMFDIDRFKAINDLHGHAAGDRVLQRVAQLALGLVRSGDLLARYGGEEFLLLAPETDRSQAVQLAERIRAELHAADVPVDHTTIRFTASFGIASLNEDDRDASAVIARADQALYSAKESGRDRVVAA
jgi:diguanylate cyclase (GGDEF)-like protein